MSRYNSSRGFLRPFQIIRVYDNEEEKQINESILAHDCTFFDEEEKELESGNIETKEIDKSIVKLGYGLNMIKNKKSKISNLVLDEGTKSIEKREYYSRDIKEITLNDDLEIIEDSAFKSNKIKNLKLNSNLKVIAKYAFSDNQIEDIEFNEGLEVIDAHAFKNNKISKVNLPSTIKTIKVCAFKNNNIKHVNLPDSITEIDFGAFDFGVSFTYKGNNYDSKHIDYFGSDFLLKLAHIKSLVPNVNFDNLFIVYLYNLINIFEKLMCNFYRYTFCIT
jgi:hypothetical protein